MSVEDINTIDFIGTEENSETIVLTVSDHLNWGRTEHLETLQEKLNTYLKFIESGEIFDTYPNAKGKKVKIQVMLKHEPDDEGKEFLRKCTDVILSAGFQFNYGVL
jgi:hypothetical protein